MLMIFFLLKNSELLLTNYVPRILLIAVQFVPISRDLNFMTLGPNELTM